MTQRAPPPIYMSVSNASPTFNGESKTPDASALIVALARVAVCILGPILFR